MPKVLLIDDDPSILTILDILLRHQGYDVVLANNSWKGLELYHHQHPDVIVLDLNMPEMDGITVLKQIRRVDLKQLVIVLTAGTAPETERQAHTLGVSEFIVKGSSLHLLGETLQRLLKTPAPATITATCCTINREL